MGRKLVVLFLVLLAVSMGSLSAQEQLESNTPSEFDVGIILNYSYADLRDQNFKEYIPTLRFQWNMLPWLGLSATGYVNGEEYASLVLGMTGMSSFLGGNPKGRSCRRTR
jgi:hypothetical protein